MFLSEKDVYLLQHPLHDLSAPVLPFPFEMADFMALANSDCFMHSSARWPEDADVERSQAINPRTKVLMMELLGHMLPVPQADSAAPPNASPAVRAEPLLTTAADAATELDTALQAVGENAKDAKELVRAALPLLDEATAKFGRDDSGVRDAAAWLLAHNAPYAPAPPTLDEQNSLTLEQPVQAFGGSVTQHSIRGTRRDDLVPAIERAQEGCRNPYDTAEVWPAFQKLADEQCLSLVGCLSDGRVKWNGSGGASIISRDAFAKRLKKMKEKDTGSP